MAVFRHSGEHCRCPTMAHGEEEDALLVSVVLEVATRGKSGQRAYGECCATGDEDVAHHLGVLA